MKKKSKPTIKTLKHYNPPQKKIKTKPKKPMRLKFSQANYFFLSVKAFYEILISVCQILCSLKINNNKKIITYFLVSMFWWLPQ